MMVMKSFDKRPGDEREEQALSALEEAITKGRYFDGVCRTIIEIINDLHSDEASRRPPPNRLPVP